MKPRTACLTALLYLGLIVQVTAQEQLPLDQATLNRLGLVFSRVEAADGTTGTRFPARVIASPFESSVVTALHEGTLASWSTRPGASIQAGDELAQLRSPQVLALQQAWREAVADAEQAEVALARDRRLFESGVIAEQRLQDSERLVANARFQRTALTAALEQAGHSGQDLDALAAGTQVPGVYRVRSPLAGVVGSLEHNVGEVVTAGEVLLRLNSEEHWLSADLPVAVAARLMEGQALRVAEGNVEVRVRQVAQSVDSATQTAQVLASFAGASPLLPGQVVSLGVPPRDAGVLVPAEAVVHNGAETLVYVRVPEGVEARTLELQAAGGDYLATRGLAAGEEVVVRGAAILKGISLGLGGE